MTYLTLKYLHILSMVLLFGVGLGSAFYKWMADHSQNLEHIAQVNRHVIFADWIFTTPTVIFQPVSGLILVYLAGIPVATFWISASLALYILAGLCWIPVVWLQIRMSKMADTSLKQQHALPDKYWQYARIWFWLGVPAFTAMLLVVFLMVFKTY